MVVFSAAVSYNLSSLSYCSASKFSLLKSCVVYKKVSVHVGARGGGGGEETNNHIKER